MNTTELPVRHDVTAFVARVRELLSDLSEEDRLELTEGLEADLADQVAEQGGGALGDPEAYARELRSAGGFDPAPRRRLPAVTRMPLPERLDAVRAWWGVQVARPRVRPVWDVVVALRPAWWVVRAWVAAVAVCILLPGYEPWGIAWLPGVGSEVGLAVLAVCVVLSTLVGLGRLWPGARPAGTRGTTPRLVLVALNLAAVGLLLFAQEKVTDVQWARDRASGFYDSSWTRDMGMLNRGEQVCNIAAYDAGGQPLTGVQLFDQAGRPLDVRCYGQDRRTVPWVLGDVTRWNVFPLGERDRPARRQADREDLTGAAFPTPDRATTPAVTNPLVPEDAEPTKARGGDGSRDGGTRDRTSRSTQDDRKR